MLYCAKNIHINQGLRTPVEEIAFNARPKIKSQSQIFRYGRSIFCLPQRPKFSDFFDLCLHWVSVVRGDSQSGIYANFAVVRESHKFNKLVIIVQSTRATIGREGPIKGWNRPKQIIIAIVNWLVLIYYSITAVIIDN